jgi:hypothetical protein
MPVRQALGRWPYLDELPALVIADKDDDAWDAWVGNDASALCANRLEFGRWAARSIKVSWSGTVATYMEVRESGPNPSGR